MPSLTTHDEIAQLAEGLPGGMFNDLLTPGTNNGRSETWLAFLSEFTRETNEPEFRESRTQEHDATDVVSSEARGPLRKVAASPWRSLGGYFDYSDWKDRERFLELDRAIASTQYGLELECESDAQII